MSNAHAYVIARVNALLSTSYNDACAEAAKYGYRIVRHSKADGYGNVDYTLEHRWEGVIARASERPPGHKSPGTRNMSFWTRD